MLRHPWAGESTCEQADVYRKSLPARHEREAQTLASLTGWDIHAIREKMELDPSVPTVDRKWWQRLWLD